MGRWSTTSVLLLATACGSQTGTGMPSGAAPKPEPASTPAPTPVAAPVWSDQAAPQRLAVIEEGLTNPESALYDPALGVWFVSNLNGEPSAKDNNGYIARVTGDGKVDSLKFIAAGRGGVTLHAPKGMAVVGDTLWVADIDVVRAFHKRTGAPIAAVSLEGQAKFLNDVARGPDGLYVTDTEGNRIYRIDATRTATVALETGNLAGPNGLTWHADSARFIVVPYNGMMLFSWRPGDQHLSPIGMGPGWHDGVEVMPTGGLLVSSWADSNVFVMRNGQAAPVIDSLASPADIGLDAQHGRLAIPMLTQNRLEIWALPARLLENPRVPEYPQMPVMQPPDKPDY